MVDGSFIENIMRPHRGRGANYTIVLTKFDHAVVMYLYNV